MAVKRVRLLLGSVLSALLAVGVVSALPASAVDGPVVSMGNQSGLERDAVTGSVFMPVYLSAPAVEPVVVSFSTVDGTATAGADYLRWGTPTNPRTVTIPAGATQTQINVPVLTDNEAEADETFSVVIESVSGATATVGDDTGTATIIDADAASVINPAITVSNPTVIEGDQGDRRAQFQVHLSRAPVSNVTISYATADGSAAAGTDYTAKFPGTVVFAPGQISKTIDVLVNPNTTLDGTRAFTLDVTVTGGSPVEELNLTGTATIIDDDSAAVQCAPGTYSVDGNAPCTPAPPGFFVDTAGATQATPCAPGSYQDQAGQTECVLAPIGTYVQNVGQTAATACPDGSTTLATGSTSADDCVALPIGAVAITAAGSGHSCALLGDGTARCWGINGSGGRLGDGTNFNSSVPVVVSGLTDAVAIEAGGDHTCAVLGDGTARCWGANSDGQLGNGTTTNSNVPVTVPGLTDVVAISAGTFYTCAALADGTVRCWGSNSSGRLGNGTTTSSNVPVIVPGLADVVAISASSNHVCAVLSNGSARCWGANSSGQLGNGTTGGSSNVPVVVSGLTNAVDISAGGGHTCALLSDGSARCWGSNSSGRLGNGTTGGSSNVPVVVSGMTNAVDISAGGGHTCTLLGDGSLRCWGAGTRGQLGDGTATSSNVPVAVSGLTDATDIGGGGNHACAVLSDGSARCWGDNVGGMLGNGGDGGSHPLPVAVVGIP